MRPLFTGAFVAIAVGALVGMVTVGAYLKGTGLSARATPGAVETALARRARLLAVPGDYRSLRNPVLVNDESIRNGRAHFADHCASCHANDGSGNTNQGTAMFPPAPDMRQAATQDLSDGQLFYFIEHGVRFTGMPAWGTGTIEGEEASWHLVSFIRGLPNITPEEIAEMEDMNPRPPSEIRREIEEQRFLEGEPPTRAEPATQAYLQPGGTS